MQQPNRLNCCILIEFVIVAFFSSQTDRPQIKGDNGSAYGFSHRHGPASNSTYQAVSVYPYDAYEWSDSPFRYSSFCRLIPRAPSQSWLSFVAYVLLSLSINSQWKSNLSSFIVVFCVQHLSISLCADRLYPTNQRWCIFALFSYSCIPLSNTWAVLTSSSV